MLSDDKMYYLVGFKGNCCNKPFNATYIVNQNKRFDANLPGEMTTVHPSSSSRVFPDIIREQFPRFVELYNQSYYAEDKGYLSLAGAGYRNALEVLVKDFAKNVLNEEHSSIKNKTLCEAIKAYVPGVDPTIAAHGIRLIGNNFTHWEQDVDLMDLETLHAFFEVVLSSITTKLLLNKLTVENKVPKHQIGDK